MIAGMEKARFGVAHLDRISLHYAEMGPTDGERVFLLHGFPETCFGWRKQMTALAEAGFHVIAPDLRGCGMSGKPNGIDAYDLDEMAEDIIMLGNHFGAEQLNLAGHGTGGMLCWWLTSIKPELVKKTIMVSAPHPSIWQHALSKNRHTRRQNKHIRAMKRNSWPEKHYTRNNYQQLVGLMKNASRADAFDETDMEFYKRVWMQSGSFSPVFHGYRALLKKNLPSTNALPRIDKPVLLIWGDKDSFHDISLAEESIALCERGGMLRLPEGTHWVHREEAATINDMMVTFLRTRHN